MFNAYGITEKVIEDIRKVASVIVILYKIKIWCNISVLYFNSKCTNIKFV